MSIATDGFGTLFKTNGGGGGDPFLFPDRVDCSVNNARVWSPYAATPVLHVQTGGNVAGGYNGGGVGNKCILGMNVGHHLALGALASFSYTWLDLVPFISGLAVYANLVVDINGDGSVYKIFVADPASVALNNITTVVNPDTSSTSTWTPANNFLVVNDLLGVVPVVSTGPSWVNHGYQVADILVVYPNARLARASSLDGGLPKTVITPAYLLCTGDSATNSIRAFKLSDITFNGVFA